MTQQCGKGPAGSWGESTVLPPSASSLALPPPASSTGRRTPLKIPTGTQSWEPGRGRGWWRKCRNHEDAEDQTKAAFLATVNLCRHVEKETLVASTRWVWARWTAPARVSRHSRLRLLQDNPIGDWDGVFNGKLLCNFASLEHTRLVPICDVMPGESSTFPLFSLVWAPSRPWRGPVPSVLAALPLLPLLPLCVLLAAVHRGLFVYMAGLFWKSGQIPRGSLFPRVAYWFVYECESCCSHEENFDSFSFFLSVTCFGPSLSLKWL